MLEKEFGNYCKKLRIKNHLTVEEFADVLQVHPNKIQLIEKGKMSANYAFIRKMVEVFDLSDREARRLRWMIRRDKNRMNLIFSLSNLIVGIILLLMLFLPLEYVYLADVNYDFYNKKIFNIYDYFSLNIDEFTRLFSLYVFNLIFLINISVINLISKKKISKKVFLFNVILLFMCWLFCYNKIYLFFYVFYAILMIGLLFFNLYHSIISIINRILEKEEKESEKGGKQNVKIQSK